MASAAIEPAELNIKNQSSEYLLEINASRSENIQSVIPLKPGERLRQKMAGGGTHFFKVSLAAGQFLRVIVEQRGIILNAVIKGPSGIGIAEMDSPSGAHGTIYISAIAEASGDYLLSVYSVEKWANEGEYEIVIEELRAATPADKEQVSAEKSFSDARKDVKKDMKESRLAAIKKYGEALSYWKKIGDSHWTALTLYSIGTVLRQLGDRRAAEKYFQESLAISLDARDWRLRASALNDHGFNYVYLGENQKALEYLNEALNLFIEHEDRRGQASALNNIGLLHARDGQMRLAMEFYEKALPLRRAENDRAGEFNVLNNVGGLYDFVGEPHKALDYYGKALKVWQDLDESKQLNNRDQLATGFNNVGVAHHKLGEWQSAIMHYEIAMKIFEEVGNLQRGADALDNIGDLYAALGDPLKAGEYYNKALRLLQEKVKDPAREAAVLIHIGKLYLSQSKPAEASGYFERALALAQPPQVKAEALTGVGVVKALLGEPQAAIEAYGQALTLRKQIGDRRGEALTLQKRGEAYTLLGKQAEALVDLNSALSLWRAVADRRGEAATLYSIARIERDANELAAALKRSEDVINIVESLRTKVSSHKLRTSYFAIQQNYYELYIDLRMRLYERDHSAEHLAAALVASERSRARSLIDTLAEAQADLSQGVDEALARQAREVQQKLNAKAQAQMELLNRKHSDSEAAAISREIDGLIGDYDSLQAKIRASNPKYAQLIQPQPLSLQDIQKMLDDDTLLLEYALGDEKSYLWLVSNTSIAGSASLPKRSEIEAAARNLYDLITASRARAKTLPEAPRDLIKTASARYDSQAAAMSKVLLGPVAGLLGKKRLLIAADGVLQYLPFNALPVPAASGRNEKAQKGTATGTAPAPYMIEEHEIISLHSASAHSVMRSEMNNRRQPSLNIAVLADPVLDKDDYRFKTAREKSAPSPNNAPSPSAPSRSLPDNETLRSGLNLQPLPSTEREAAEIKKANPPAPSLFALGFDASRTTVAKLQERQYGVVHFATHGILNTEHPELSGVVLSLFDADGRPQNDGILRLHDIYKLKLPAEMVVLSACSTGLGNIIKGEGLIGLTRGFMYAGSPRVIASLWRVDDFATAQLMGRLYRHLFRGGISPAAALRKAQLEMLKSKRLHLPFYWAGFVFQGEWREIR